MSATATNDVIDTIVDSARAVEDQVGSVVLGKSDQVRMATAALISGEHLLLNDLPGVGKTTLGLALSRVIEGTFGRVQGTPDLLPTDLAGVTIYDQPTNSWTFRPGPLANNVVVVDELNRITPRTQSALLEAMAEGHVTIDGVTRTLPDPFLVVATMNPVGSAGTFTLTSGQLDRFGASISIGPPGREAERRIVQGDGGQDRIEHLSPILTTDQFLACQATVRQVNIHPGVTEYVLDICDVLRSSSHLSARAPKSVISMAKSLAVLDGRNFVVPGDVKRLALPCLAHRLVQEGEPLDSHYDRVTTAVDTVVVPSVSE